MVCFEVGCMRILIALFDRIGEDVLYEPLDAQTNDYVNYHISEFKKLWEGDYDILYNCDIDSNELNFTVKFNDEYDRTMLLLKWA
jgi:hypothetical protein